jgi:NADPH2:quinone reductase
MKAIRVHEPGGPDVLRLDDNLPVPKPEAGDAVVRLEQIGVNFLDIYQRTGFYKMPLPFTPGNEAAGVVVGVASDVAHVRTGDRVAYAMVPGAYSEYARVPAAKLVPLPNDVDARTGAALLLQGLTAQYLTRSTYAVRRGDTMVVLAAAGGLGLQLVRVGKHLGATVIGLTSTDAKAKEVAAAGADHVVLSTNAAFDAAIREISHGRGVDVVYDSVGKDTFARSLASLRPRGCFVLVGQASGGVPPIEVPTIAKASLFFTRPTLAHYMATHDELAGRAAELFDWYRQGVVRVTVDRTFPLAQAADAHRRLESRESVGKILLQP